MGAAFFRVSVLLRAGSYMKPSSRRASSDIMSMPQGGSQVSSTSTVL